MFKKLIVFWVMLFICTPAFSQATYEAQYQEAETARLLMENGQYADAYNELLPLFEKENVVATHYLGIMKYFGLHVVQDLEISARLFFTASKNGEAGGNIDSAYWLARNFYLNPQSEFFNEKEGVRLMYGVELSGHVEGAFCNGLYSMQRSAEAENKVTLIKFAIESFQKAFSGGKLEAGLLWYIMETQLRNTETNYRYSSLEALHTAANVSHELQAEAAYELALLYKTGEFYPQSYNNYTKYLKLSADLGDEKAAYFLGKALVDGVVGDPDYEEAEFYTQFALDNAGNDEPLKFSSELQLERIEIKRKQEQDISTFEVPRDHFLEMLAMQQFLSSKESRSIEQKVNIFEPSNNNLGNSNNRITTFEFSSDAFASSGTTYRRSGNKIRGSNGITYDINGDTMRGSDGTRFKFSNNRMRSSDGTNYRFVGKNIYGSDGSRCRITGRTTRCY